MVGSWRPDVLAKLYFIDMEACKIFNDRHPAKDGKIQLNDEQLNHWSENTDPAESMFIWCLHHFKMTSLSYRTDAQEAFEAAKNKSTGPNWLIKWVESDIPDKFAAKPTEPHDARKSLSNPQTATQPTSAPASSSTGIKIPPNISLDWDTIGLRRIREHKHFAKLQEYRAIWLIFLKKERQMANKRRKKKKKKKAQTKLTHERLGKMLEPKYFSKCILVFCKMFRISRNFE